jgi:hypothetical protein
MSRVDIKTLFTSILGTLALGLAGCADNNSAMFVRGVLVPAQDCTVRADPNGAMFLRGTVDLAFTDSYVGALLVGNQLVRRGSKNQLRVETSRIALKGAEVTVLDDQENELANYTVPGTGFVDPGTGEDPGYGILGATLLPPGLAGVDGLFIIDVKVFGTTLGGSDLESVPLRYPIQTCTGCLISYPADADDPAQPGYQCVQGTPPESSSCFTGQDQAIDCRSCQQNPICQSPP